MTTVSTADKDTMDESRMWFLVNMERDTVIVSLYPSLTRGTVYDTVEQVVAHIEVTAQTYDDAETFDRESDAAWRALPPHPSARSTARLDGYEIDKFPGLMVISYGMYE
jgi:hypothetical protein